jgi:transketolase
MYRDLAGLATGLGERKGSMPQDLSSSNLQQMANAVRALSMDAVQNAGNGHPGMPMGMADVATVLFSKFLKFDPKDPKWADRDRFILSAGHGSILQYSLLHLSGYEDMTIEEIKNLRQMGAKTAGHPEFGHADGIETTTGPLGQGIANAVGFALAERMLNAEYGDELVDHHTYVIAGDGCLMEGISHEAISLAGHLKLNKLIVLFDDNGITIDGPTNISVSDDQVARFKASNWNAFEVDGHDVDAVAAAIEKAKSSDKPTMIACKTTIGFGAPTKAGKSSSHGAALGVEEIAGAREALNWPHAPFEIPDDIRANWSAAGSRSRDERGAWEGRLAANKGAAEFTRRMKGDLPAGWEDKVAAYKAQLLEDRPTMATRAASGKALEVLFDAIPEMVGGSADLTGSNLTKAGKQGPLTADNYLGRYIYYGVREHGMAAAMNGIVLHGGFIPYGGTFMVFTDYCRPAIRLSALMNQRVIYVMTHDSIGLGEDGPTHQPVEHLAALRAIPNLKVFRPCDALETMECWEAALKSEGPSVLVLSRQNAPFCRVGMSEDWADLGAFILSPASEDRQATLLASGTEVSMALDAQKVLESDGIPTAVVSMPCWEKFLEQPPHYREEVIRWDSLHVAVEAAGSFGWDRWIGRHGTVIGVEGFGASAPAEQLYEHFGITVDGIVNAVKSRL